MVDVECQIAGELTVGPSGQTSGIWDRLTTGGFVSDLYLTTPAIGQFSAVLPRCFGLTAGNR